MTKRMRPDGNAYRDRNSDGGNPPKDDGAELFERLKGSKGEVVDAVHNQHHQDRLDHEDRPITKEVDVVRDELAEAQKAAEEEHGNGDGTADRTNREEHRKEGMLHDRLL